MVLAACALALRQGSPPKGAAAPAFRMFLLFRAIFFSLKGDLLSPPGKLGPWLRKSRGWENAQNSAMITP
jgi:hypothetical protein